MISIALTSPALALRLGQVLHVHVQVAWFIALEGLVDQHRLLGLEGVEGCQPHDGADTCRGPNARHGANELARDGQQVIHRQKQGAPQVNHHRFLRRCEHTLKAIGRMRAVAKDLVS